MRTVSLYLLDNYCIRICKEHVKIQLLPWDLQLHLSRITMRFTESNNWLCIDRLICVDADLFSDIIIESWLLSINGYVIWVVLSYLQVQVSYKFYIFLLDFFNFWEEDHLEWWLTFFLVQCAIFDFVSADEDSSVQYLLCLLIFHYFSIFIFPKSFCLSVYTWVCLLPGVVSIYVIPSNSVLGVTRY